MARIRTIKPEFWRSSKLATLSEFSRLVAIAILNVADDEGFFLADERLIRGEVFPFEDDYGRITVALRELSGIGYVVFRTHPEKGEIGWVQNFATHQVINKPSPSKIRVFFENTSLPEYSGSTTVGLPAGTGNREQGNRTGNGEGSGNELPHSPLPPAFQTEEFQQLWDKRKAKHFETQGQYLPPTQADLELMELSRRGYDNAIKDLQTTILKGYGRTVCQHDKFANSPTKAEPRKIFSK